MRRNVLLGAALAVMVSGLLAEACGGGGATAFGANEETTIVLAGAAGACAKTAPAPVIFAKKNGKVKIHIESTCADSNKVYRVYDFTVKGGSAETPMKTTEGECTLNGNGKCTIDFEVLDAGPGGKTGAYVYTYKLMLKGGQEIDPEVVIEW